MANKFFLKNYPVEELKAGMVVGRSIYDENMKELVAEGAVLTNQLIFSILERPIFAILIKEKTHFEPIVDKHVLDESYVQHFEFIMQELRRVFQSAREMGTVDVNSLKNLVSNYFNGMTDGMKAISHIHNIVRSDDYLLHHSINVAILAGVMGKWMHKSKAEIDELILAGLLHDVGKTQVSLDILNKPSKLTDMELKAVQQHSSKGFDLLRYGILHDKSKILMGILQHHERMDRSGYPAKLPGDKISEYGRILAVIDMYDAMAANKVYSLQRSPFDIFSILSDEMINKLDTSICVLFVKNVCHSLNGNWVELNNGKRAKIIYIDESRIQSLPVVQCEDDSFIDLNTEKNIKITKLLSNIEVLQNF